MNILVFSWRDPKHPLAGGAEQVMHEHMKGWIAKGHTVTLFSSAFVGSPRIETLDDVRIIRKGGQLLDVQIRAFFWYLFETSEKFDVVIDQFHGLPFFTPLYVRVPKLAVIQEVAQEVWLQNHLPKPFDLLVGVVGYLCEPLFFLPYINTHFMTGSQSALEDVVNMGISRHNITVVPHGVKLSIPKNLPKKESVHTVVFLGALAKDKGITEALKCFAILSKRGKYQFWVIGKASALYLAELVELCKALGIQKKVKFWGFVDEKKKFQLLSRSHVLINPSTREGWGLVNTEANAVSTPVVAYSSPGLVDSVKNGVNGSICEENTPASLAYNVENLLSNQSRLKRLGRGAKKWSEQFTWEKSRQKSLDLLHKITFPHEEIY